VTLRLAAALAALPLIAAGPPAGNPAPAAAPATAPTSAASKPAAPKPAAPASVAEPTPMAQRVVGFAALDKRTGRVQAFTGKPGSIARWGALTIRVRACETTPPWERPSLTGAFLQVDVAQKRGGVRRAFSGWLFAESPSLNSFDHPVYDVWVKSCTMSFPDRGPDTVVVGRSAPAPKPAASASSAPKSPESDSAEPN
jgi:hypothetical protein